jgi:carboxymethylenebutenolidase
VNIPGELIDSSLVSNHWTALPVAGFDVPVFVARPTSELVRPGIVLLHEAFGLVEHIQDVARRLAALGYDVAAPDLYAREGAPDSSDINDVLRRLFSLSDSQARGDILATQEYLQTLPESNGEVAVIGFCMGGRLSLVAAVDNPALAAVVDCWGANAVRRPDPTLLERLGVQPNANVPPAELASRITAQVLLISGSDDGAPSPQEMRELERALSQAGVSVERREFANAGHAFFADYRDTYRAEAAHAMWPVLVDFLKQALRGT